MPSQDSYATMLNYQIDNLSLNINHNFIFPENGEIKLNPSFESFYKKINETRYEVTIKFKLLSDEEHQKPFSLCFDIKGLFEIRSFEKKEFNILLKTTTLMTLFPYLRQTVTEVSTLSGFPPLILPIMNMQALSEGIKEIK